jgi:hypothetical protein
MRAEVEDVVCILVDARIVHDQDLEVRGKGLTVRLKGMDEHRVE